MYSYLFTQRMNGYCICSTLRLPTVKCYMRHTLKIYIWFVISFCVLLSIPLMYFWNICTQSSRSSPSSNGGASFWGSGRSSGEGQQQESPNATSMPSAARSGPKKYTEKRKSEKVRKRKTKVKETALDRKLAAALEVVERVQADRGML